MSRCRDWNNALNGMINMIQNTPGIKTYEHNWGMELLIINAYCKKNRITGSLSERVLKIEPEFKKFREYVKRMGEKSLSKTP